MSLEMREATNARSSDLPAYVLIRYQSGSLIQGIYFAQDENATY